MIRDPPHLRQIIAKTRSQKGTDNFLVRVSQSDGLRQSDISPRFSPSRLWRM